MTNTETDYLEEERKKIWQRIESLESSVNNIKTTANEAKKLAEGKISLDEATAKEALTEAKTHSEEARIKNEKASNLLEQVKKTIDSYKKNETLLNNAIRKAEELSEKCEHILKTESVLLSSQENIEALQSQVNSSLVTAKQTESQIKIIETDSANCYTKIADLQSKAANLKGEIEHLRDKIIGYSYKDTETGEENRESGLKEELEQAFQNLSSSISSQEESMKKFVTTTKAELNTLKSNYDTTFEEKKKRIEELLPGALTTGLSEAYTQKKRDEEKRHEKYQKTFRNSILALAGISIIPIIVNIVLYFGYDHDIIQILKNLPTSLAFVLPLYLPFFWLAMNANKGLNLSRRLIEEYSHKEVLSRTFQGLSQQVKELEQENMSSQLKNRLLFNMISVSSENPGKLIKDYNKSDNPLFEVLDKSIELADTVEKFNNVPGIGKLFGLLNRRQQKKQEKAEDRLIKGLEIQDELENEEKK